jgi:hypothetical protein
MPSHTTAKYKKKRKFLIEKFGGVCVSCGTTERLEFHIVGNGSGKAPGGFQHLELIEHYLITKEKPVTLLCPKCHIKEHLTDDIVKNFYVKAILEIRD